MNYQAQIESINNDITKILDAVISGQIPEHDATFSGRSTKIAGVDITYYLCSGIQIPIHRAGDVPSDAINYTDLQKANTLLDLASKISHKRQHDAGLYRRVGSKFVRV